LFSKKLYQQNGFITLFARILSMLPLCWVLCDFGRRLNLLARQLRIPIWKPGFFAVKRS